jgi:hypothetical protein
MEGPRLVVDRLWPEEGRVLDEEALAQALARHEEALS